MLPAPMQPGACRALGAAVFVAVLAGQTAAAQSDLSPHTAVYLDRAQAETTIARLEPIADEPGHAGGAPRAGALLELALAYRSLGRYERAAQTVRQASLVARSAGEPRASAIALLEVGDTLLLQGERHDALDAFQRALAASMRLDDAPLQAAALNGLGNARHALGELEGARDAYARARALLAEASGGTFGLRLSANLGRAEAALGNVRGATRILGHAVAAAQSMAESPDKAFSELSLGRACEFAYAVAREAPLLELAEGVYERVAAGHADSAHLHSLASGYLGGLRLRAGELGASILLTERALYDSRRLNALELSSRWYWQMGRIARAEGRGSDALAALRRAVQLAQDVRAGPVPRRLPDTAGDSALYFELAEALIDESAGAPSPARAARLVEARSAVEGLKARQLQDYFEDRCVAAFTSRTIGIDDLGKRTAVLYLVPLQERLELLLTIGGAVQHATVPVPALRLEETVDRFRRHLETRTNRRYLREAQTLHEWIVDPVEDALAAASVDTLVFVPHGKLFTIPLAALHDGKQFLAARYAVSTTPGLTLTDPRALERSRLRVLLAGISKENQGFAALPRVEEELDAVAGLYPARVLKNEDFEFARFAAALEREAYPVVHVASHGQFSANPDETFLLTYDGQITMDALEELLSVTEFRTEPVGLLTLSACQTAAGDARSALGLAGVAVKSGARSALATLWFVDDASSARVVAEFYRELASPGVSKAQALSTAQMRVASDPRYEHPAYWAAFLLIGNWL